MSGVFNRVVQRMVHLQARMRRGMTLGVRTAIFDADNNVFLVKHGYVSGWHMPGGGVDPGETLAMAAKREALEEGAIAIADPMQFFGMYLNTANGRDHVALFICHHWSEVGPPIRNFEIVDSGFYPVSDLPEGATASTRRRLAEIAAGAPATDIW